MKKITKIDIDELVTGIITILKDCESYSVKEFERLVCEQKQVSKKEAEKVTDAIISSGKVGWEIFGNNFVLLS